MPQFIINASYLTNSNVGQSVTRYPARHLNAANAVEVFKYYFEQHWERFARGPIDISVIEVHFTTELERDRATLAAWQNKAKARLKEKTVREKLSQLEILKNEIDDLTETENV